MPPDCPAPAADAAAHSRAVADAIGAAIDAAGGSLPFDEFMRLALYAPGLGYYSAGATAFGEAGDFVTAPELSPLFGQCVAVQCADVLAATGGGDIVEIGAGTGRMAAQALRALRDADALPSRYRIVEVGAGLRARQRATIERLVPDYAPIVDWLDGPPAEPWRGALVGNEVIDALPVVLFGKTAGGIVERRVTRDGAGFAFADAPAPVGVRAAVARLEDLLGTPFPVGYRGELRPMLNGWIASVTASMNTGMALFIDYGLPRASLYLPERAAGTLICHYRHRAHGDALLWPGLNDITAWVDFTALAEAGLAAGLSLAGMTTQAHFLAGCGIDTMLATDGTPAADALAAAAAVRRLMLPGEMGEAFKAIGLARGVDVALRGASLRDLAATL